MKRNYNSILALYYTIMAIVITVSCSTDNQIKEPDTSELYRINVNGKVGYINQYGDVIIEPMYDDGFYCFTDSVCYVRLGDRNAIINTNGEIIVELDDDIDFVEWFLNGYAHFKTKKDKYGIMYKDGTIIVPPIYASIEFDNGFGFCIKDTLENCGYFYRNGEFIIPCQYNGIDGYGDGLIAVEGEGGKHGYIDTLGILAIDTIYDEAGSFGNGLARVKIDGTWRFIDKQGVIQDSMVYDDILTGFSDNRAFVKQGQTIWLIDSLGDLVKDITADSVFAFREGYATFKLNDKYGKVDTMGTVVIPAKYEEIGPYHKGLASFKRNEKYGLVDTMGVEIVSPIHNFTTSSLRYGMFLLYCGIDTLIGDYAVCYYYNKVGDVIWKDICGNIFTWPNKPTKEDFISYFDSRLSDLSPIEGIYYATFERIAVDRETDHESSNGSKSHFYAVIRYGYSDSYIAYDIEDVGTYWVKKFVQIGESNVYAVVNSGESTWAEDGKMILEDPNRFEITLRQDGNNYYNWYVKCEFIKDYPTSAEYEQVRSVEWTGTGFAIADGYVVTNYHVINGAKSIIIRGVNGDDNITYKGYVAAKDKSNDLAIIKIVDKKFKGFDEIPYCIGKSVPEVGDEIYVLGYPNVSTMGKEVKLTDGIISAASGFKGNQNMYQISAPVQPGNSGGPLFDKAGNVVGVICAKHADTENANYAIKISNLYALVNKSELGIRMSDSNNIKSSSMSSQVKQIKPFVYIIECSSH